MISLNYTDSLDQIAHIMNAKNTSFLQIDNNVLHPHGVLSSGKGIILGVNDESQIDGDLIKKDDKYSKKMIKSSLIEASYKEVKNEAEKYIKDSQLICLYGVSLGKTDKGWWDLLVKALKEDKNKRLVIFWYKTTENDPEEPILKKLFDDSTIDEELKSRIKVCFHKHILFNERFFRLSETVKLEMIHVKAGSFWMGSPTTEAERRENELRHYVELTKDFWIGKFPVTQEQWKAVMGTPWNTKFKGDKLPVESINYEAAKSFCDKINDLFKDKLPNGYTFALPTEAQWEYACRAGKETPFSFDDVSFLFFYNRNYLFPDFMRKLCLFLLEESQVTVIFIIVTNFPQGDTDGPSKQSTFSIYT